MEQTAVLAGEAALLGLHLALAERNDHDVVRLFAEIKQTRAAHEASESGL